jgi:hypothetical protein
VQWACIILDALDGGRVEGDLEVDIGTHGARHSVGRRTFIAVLR